MLNETPATAGASLFFAGAAFSVLFFGHSVDLSFQPPEFYDEHDAAGRRNGDRTSEHVESQTGASP